MEGDTSSDAPWVLRLLECYVCNAQLDQPGPCPMPDCEGKDLEDASDGVFFCSCCGYRQRKPGLCAIVGCEKEGRDLWEDSERSWRRHEREALNHGDFFAESKRPKMPS